MKISYVSDLHLEFRLFPDLSKEQGGDVLILAGDIITAAAIRENRTDKASLSVKKYMSTHFKEFIDKFTHVFYVMGNHEHYQSVFSTTKNQLRKQFDNLGLNKIEIFDNDVKMVDDVLFIGCTLWTDFKGGNPLVMNEVQGGMNDYHVIYAHGEDEFERVSKNRAITPEFTLNEHTKSIAYIKEVLNQNKTTKTVIFTHMAPSYESINKEHAGNGLDYAYASDLSELILDSEQIEYWIHGHTHENEAYLLGNTIIVSNQRGYSHEHCFKEFVGVRRFEL